MSNQSLNSTGGESAGSARDDYVSRGLFGSIIIMACVGAGVATILAARYAWSWTPPSTLVNSAPKGGWPPEPTWRLALNQVFGGAMLGAVLGTIGGIGVMMLRSIKDPVVPP